DELRARYWAGFTADNLARITTGNVTPLATKTFNIVAGATNQSNFSFNVSPTPFTVNQGDSVVINISVSGNDASSIGHGILMEQYIESGVDVPRGQSKQILFVATIPGQFAFGCTQPSCGISHANMFGIFNVIAQATPPSITSIDPISGPTTGGNTVAINGANFTSGATVKFDTTNATNVSVSSTRITCVAPAHNAGQVTVTVTNPDAQVATTNYTYVAPALSVTSISPSSGTTSGGTAVTISGSLFKSGATV